MKIPGQLVLIMLDVLECNKLVSLATQIKGAASLAGFLSNSAAQLREAMARETSSRTKQYRTYKAAAELFESLSGQTARIASPSEPSEAALFISD
jgi:hypothetical protein